MAQIQRKRMLWYYSAIIDWMIANPGRPLYECAAHIGRTPTTLSIIINSDMFKAALAERKESFRMHHDIGIIQKTTQIAHASLDAILATIEKKKDTVPLDQLQSISDSSLARLGYSAKQTPAVGVTINNTSTQVVIPASASDLEEARMALRTVQEQRARQLSKPQTIEADYTELPNEGAGLVLSDEEEEERAPSPLPT